MSTHALNAATNEETSEISTQRVTVSVEINLTELRAVEGWKLANDCPSLSAALRELARLGLLSELSSAHALVKSIRGSVD